MFAMVNLTLMVKISLLTLHVAASLFPGNCCFTEVVFSFAFVVLPHLRIPSWHRSKGKVTTPLLWPRSDNNLHHAWLCGSLPCVQASLLPLMSEQGVRVDYATWRLFALQLKEWSDRLKEKIYGFSQLWYGSAEKTRRARMFANTGQWILQVWCVPENLAKRLKCVLLYSLRSGLWIDQRSILMSNPSWFWNIVELKENQLKTYLRKILFSPLWKWSSGIDYFRRLWRQAASIHSKHD